MTILVCWSMFNEVKTLSFPIFITLILLQGFLSPAGLGPDDTISITLDGMLAGCLADSPDDLFIQSYI